MIKKNIDDLSALKYIIRHRSIINAMTNLIAALAAYAIEPLKVSAFKLLEKQVPVIAQSYKTPN